MSARAIESARYENGEPLPEIRLGQTYALRWDNMESGAKHTPPLTSRVVRVACQGSHLAHIAIGVDAVATADDAAMPTTGVERFVVRPGERVSVYPAGSAYLLTVTVTEAGEIAP